MQNDLINGKTPGEIKKGLRRCQTVCLEDCPYYRTGIKCSECTTYLSKDALALIEHLEAQQPKWISVDERLPEERENPITRDFEEVICACDFGGIPRIRDTRTYKFGNGHFYNGFQVMDSVVTRWMPLPEPPKGE